MADPRPSHTHQPSLLNQPTPPFPGAANAMYPNHRYGNRGPERAMGNRGTKREGPPQSIADHINDAIRRVAGLTPRQRLAVHNEMVRLCRDISFMKMVADQTVRGVGATSFGPPPHPFDHPWAMAAAFRFGSQDRQGSSLVRHSSPG